MLVAGETSVHRAHVEDLRQDHAELRDENLLLRMGKRRAVLDSQEHLGRAGRADCWTELGCGGWWWCT